MIIFLLSDWWHNMNPTEQLLWGVALVFTLLFVIQTLAVLAGIDGGLEDIDTDIDGGSGGLNVLSVRSVLVFFSFFGWTALFVLERTHQLPLAILAAVLVGGATVFLVAYLMRSLSLLGEVGNTSLYEAVHNSADVYLHIPAQRTGCGKIHVRIRGALKEIDAVTDGAALPTGSKVRVVDLVGDDILLVEPIA